MGTLSHLYSNRHNHICIDQNYTCVICVRRKMAIVYQIIQTYECLQYLDLQYHSTSKCKALSHCHQRQSHLRDSMARKYENYPVNMTDIPCLWLCNQLMKAPEPKHSVSTSIHAMSMLDNLIFVFYLLTFSAYTTDLFP